MSSNIFFFSVSGAIIKRHRPASPANFRTCFTRPLPPSEKTEAEADGDLDQAGPDPATRSYFFTQIANRFWEDPALDDVTFDWNRLVRRRRRTLCGGWVPNIRVEEQIIEVPTPHGHNQAAVGRLFDTRIASVDELFEVFATRDTRAATVAAHH